MHTSKIVIFCLFLCKVVFLTAKPAIPLSLSDIPKEMKRVMQGHVGQTEVSKELIATSLQSYIEQFDPYKVYLLETEVAPFLNLSDAQKETLFTEYKKGSYTTFRHLNDTIQHAIKRMRTFRRGLVASRELFFDLAEQSFTIPKEYASTEDALLRRHAIYMAQCVVKLLQNSADKSSSQVFKETVRTIALELEEDENSYLYIDRQGKSLDVKAQNEMLAFHILKALTASLDAHTRYLNPREAEDLRRKLEKNYSGVGIVVEELGRAFVVREIVKGSSADTTGVIKVGDELVTIDKQPVGLMTQDRVQALLDGDDGSSVQLELQRRSPDGRYKVPINIQLQKRQITLEEGRVDTTFEQVPGGIVGIIALHSFYQGGTVTSEKDVQKALALLKSKGKLRGIILDLRDNKGGFLMQAVKVAGLFIKSGVVVAAKYSNGDIHYFRDLDPAVQYTGPFIVLISKETASAAEIVTEALKDYGIAIIVGDEKSFGKGSIQLQTVTKGQNTGDSYFKVTVGRYYGVSGKSTQVEGVKSDILVPGYLSSRKIGEEYLNGALKTDTIAPSYSDPLTDIMQKDRRWFQKYYIPYLQPKVERFRSHIPELAAKSRARIEKNSNYLRLIEGKNSIIEKKGLTETTKSLDPEELKKTLSSFQLQETVNIMNDIIKLEGNS